VSLIQINDTRKMPHYADRTPSVGLSGPIAKNRQKIARSSASEKDMTAQYVRLAAGLLLCGIVGAIPAATSAAETAKQAKPAIGAEARTALARMSKTLSAEEFSFRVHTIRVYQDSNGRLLHIFHAIDVVVRRPDRLAIHVNGDDGSTELLYSGKDVAILGVEKKKYVLISVPNNIQAMMEKVMGRLHVDFPLADFLTNSPDKAFLTGVTSGREINTVTIEGMPYRHLFFVQKGGIELELWLSKNEQSLPRRLIVTYHSLPGEPNFVAEFSNWDFAVHPADSEFAFRPPAGARQVQLKSAAGASGEGGGR
jgi:hypothetical protein